MSDPSEAEMSDFVNQFVPKVADRTNMWPVKILQTWAIKKFKTNGH